MPTGAALSLILIYIINRRAVGWTLQAHFGVAPFVGACGIAVLGALLAGLYPAYRLSRMATAEALRSE
jgi:putative ABC transport system permease protein